MIEVRDLSFGYARPDEIFRHFHWSVAGGESWVVLGPSGCGKTTLAYLLAGLRHPASGSVEVEGAPVTRPRTSTGLILQDHGLLPWEKARDNVALGLKIRRVPAAERNQEVSYWLARLGIEGVAGKYPGQLSGGQRQRVAIARTLALHPSLLLMDEPFSALDSTTREDLQELMADLSEGTGMTTVLVTHDIQEAVYLGKKILIVGYPPIEEYMVLDNPEARSQGYRQSTLYFQRCARVRQAAGEVSTGGDFAGQAGERLVPFRNGAGDGDPSNVASGLVPDVFASPAENASGASPDATPLATSGDVPVRRAVPGGGAQGPALHQGGGPLVTHDSSLIPSQDEEARR